MKDACEKANKERDKQHEYRAVIILNTLDCGMSRNKIVGELLLRVGTKAARYLNLRQSSLDLVLGPRSAVRVEFFLGVEAVLVVVGNLCTDKKGDSNPRLRTDWKYNGESLLQRLRPTRPSDHLEMGHNFDILISCNELSHTSTNMSLSFHSSIELVNRNNQTQSCYNPT
jgi:hypothetical protein